MRPQNPQSTSEPMPPALFDTQLLLAEINLEGEQLSDAATLFAPLLGQRVRRTPVAGYFPTHAAVLPAEGLPWYRRAPRAAASARPVPVRSGFASTTR